MLPSRYTFSNPQPPPSLQRKSRVDQTRVSCIPKPKVSRPGSMERLSEAGAGRRPGQQRSSSMEPPRPALAAGRQSREASVTKAPMHQRSRSQQSEGWAQMTPMSKKGYSRGTTTPMRTPSADRSGRSWQNSLDRALAFVTVKDKRPISTIKWQKETAARVNEVLEQRSSGGPSGPILLMKPLTITRFVDITSVLLASLQEKVKLDQTNYVAKLPHITKRFLYPGVVSKSWLKTVNTLHTYPTALAVLAYLTDLVLRLECPVDESWLYAEKDELICLRRQHMRESWITYQETQDFSVVNEQYLHDLKQLLGNDDERIQRLTNIVAESREALASPAEAAAREDEQRRAEVVASLTEALRAEETHRFQDQGKMDATCTRQASLLDTAGQLESENERAKQELEQLRREVAEQEMSTAERARLLDQVDYSNRVIDSKNEVLQEVTKMVRQAETELAASQKRCLATCAEYNHRLIALGTTHADCAGLVVEESDLMQESTLELVTRAVQQLREKHDRLAEQLKEAERGRAAGARRLSQQHYQLDQMKTKLSELWECVQQEKALCRTEREQAVGERERLAREIRELTERADQQASRAAELGKCEEELAYWQEQDAIWKKKLSECREYVAEQRAFAASHLEECKEQRARFLLAQVDGWRDKLAQMESQYRK